MRSPIVGEATGACRLCLRQRPIVASHILPEFVFKPIYNARHKAVLVERGGPSKKLQKGWREPLLCEECEQRLNRHETAFANVWFERPCVPDPLVGEFYAVTGLDYLTFKLFHVSILWRASVSSLPVFGAVSIGPTWEAKARGMLLKGVPGPATVFPIFAEVLCDSDGARVGKRVIWDATMTRISGIRIYNFLFGGCIWHYVVSSNWPRDRQSFCLNEQGQLLFYAADVNTYEPIAHLAKILKAGR